MSISCGNCKQSHDSKRQVFLCYLNAGKIKSRGGETPRGPKDTRKPKDNGGDSSSKKPTPKPEPKKPSPPKPEPKRGKKKPGKPKNRKRGSGPLGPSVPPSNSNSPSKGRYQMPRGRPNYHSGERCNWCGGPLGQCPCD